LRDAWIKEMIEAHKAKKMAGPMPLAFMPEAAGTLTAVIQFEVSGEENFIAHIKIFNGQCIYHDGPADKPNLVIKTPADVWLKISKDELNGQKAFMEGRYRVEGDMNLLLKMNRLFSA
jgi:putative sterol carrier protein